MISAIAGLDLQSLDGTDALHSLRIQYYGLQALKLHPKWGIHHVCMRVFYASRLRSNHRRLRMVCVAKQSSASS
jgi:hypothetical protein